MPVALESEEATSTAALSGTSAELTGVDPTAVAGNFADGTTGAMVLASVDAARAPYGSIVAIRVVLGVAALIVAVLAMWITARIILHQADDLEAGVTEILHGDTRYVFKPVGADLDGLAGHLNQMVARLTEDAGTGQ